MNRNAEPPPFSKELVISAYCQGIFPMGDDDGTISWYSPDPRCVFDFDLFHVSSRLKRTIRQGVYDVRINTCFEEVMWACADRESTWINEEIVRVYVELHELGLAHSVETFFEEKLVGGLYGVSLGGAFMGESMFFRRTDASKVALVYLVERLKERGFILLDTQYQNKHLASFNSQLIARKEYLARLSRALELDCRFD